MPLLFRYLLLVQPSAGQLSGIKISQESPELILGARWAYFCICLCRTGVAMAWRTGAKSERGVAPVKQLPDQQGLAIRLHGDFPRATTLIQQLVRGINLLFSSRSFCNPQWAVTAGGLANTGRLCLVCNNVHLNRSDSTSPAIGGCLC